MIGLEREREDLHERINRRVDEMFRLGLVEETSRLIRSGLKENQTASQALGYKQVLEHLSGERSLGQTMDLVKQKTRQFSKRQLTWFKRQLPLAWISLGRDWDPAEVAQQIEQRESLHTSGHK